MKKNVICKSICLVIILSIFSSCLFTTIVFAEENEASSVKSTEELLEEVLNHPELQPPSFYSSFESYIIAFSPTISALAELLKRPDAVVKAIYQYETLCEAYYDSNSIMHTIAKQKDFLSQLIQHLNSSGRGLDYTTTYTYVYTLENNPVLARIHTITQPYSDYEYSYINEEIARFPSVVELREPTMSYNCHSYAWYSQSENNIYWIDEPGSFLTDKTRIVNDWQIGDKIVYSKNGEVTHSGIITAVNGNTLSTITVISKWGSYGLYQHIGNDCLYTEGENITYTVYRLCTHSPNTYIRTQTNVYVHKAECPSCGYITSEDHVLDIRGFCTLCGGKGINIDFNSIKEGEENQ